MSWKEYVVGIIIGLMWFGGNCIVDDYRHIARTGYVGADGQDIILQNNPNATDPTSQQVFDFIKHKDDTELLTYSDSFQCGDFAERLHNNAEAAGIKAGWVSIQFEDNKIDHACNVFNTTDEGLLFIDCINGASYVKMEIGKEYKPHEIGNPVIRYESLGIVKNYQIDW